MSRVRVVVIGAGAFGGWSALELVRRGAQVTLVDAWGPGHARSSSGGETRVIRATYGSHVVYTRMAARALRLWREHERRSGVRLLYQTGALWIFAADTSFRAGSAAALRSEGLPFEELSTAEAGRRYPQVRFDDVQAVMVEPEAGYLLARQACEHVAACVAREGGELLQGTAPAPLLLENPLRRLELVDGRVLEADAFVFACGPWLPAIFPDVIGQRISVSRQEVYYFGTPPGSTAFDETALAVWLEFGGRFVYGIPGNARRGFKVADDSPGAVMDPTSADRAPTGAGVENLRGVVAHRFPALAGAPLIQAEVCQYESTPDASFIVDRHPGAGNVWIAGGGSGHGFKMGPAIGEHVASLVLGQSGPDPTFGLARFEHPPAGGWRAKWS